MNCSRPIQLLLKSQIVSKMMESASYTQIRCMSRVKQRHTAPRHFWMKKERAAYPEELSAENEAFLREAVEDRRASPLRQPAAAPPIPYTPGVVRTGLIARKIGVQPMWLKNGKYINATLLHVRDNHVVRYLPPELLNTNEVVQRRWKGQYRDMAGLVVGADQEDPQKFTKEYANLFLEAGIMPTRKLTRFVINPSAALSPGTVLRATHFNVGDFVDVFGKTKERGFQGVMKRWGFAGQPATHGATKTHRRPGGIGSGANKARVWPGQKMPGHMGGRYRSLRGLKILRINTKYDVIYVRGPAVPGDHNSYVLIYDTVLPLRKKKEPAKLLTPEEVADLPEDIYHPDVHQMADPSIVF
ncbi:39S ribosomal protein L3, mitochondrial-like [Pollicipes pollicipes]|uniref:39S ribosomal protein L3, mitochondrial-like n=1 Tax=Pollicipes pollicipes TaxID=41117 RepID=UPI001885487F|nr:39S ribosomal protein L3, mitochondrial-like [Pollicipes pollicipes]